MPENTAVNLKSNSTAVFLSEGREEFSGAVLETGASQGNQKFCRIFGRGSN